MIRKDTSELKGGDNHSDIQNTLTIYSIVNLDNGKRYIGRTKNPKQRIRHHFYGIKTHTHPNPLLNKESNSEFGYEILEEGISIDQGYDKELHYMMLYKTYEEEFGYNAKDKALKRAIKEKDKPEKKQDKKPEQEYQLIRVPAYIKDFKGLMEYAKFMHLYLSADEKIQHIVEFLLNKFAEENDKNNTPSGMAVPDGAK